jgi:hypothetical protein
MRKDVHANIIILPLFFLVFIAITNIFILVVSISIPPSVIILILGVSPFSLVTFLFVLPFLLPFVFLSDRINQIQLFKLLKLLM